MKLAAGVFVVNLAVFAQAADPLLVVNDNSPLSRSIAEYYARARGVPAKHVLRIRTTVAEEIDRGVYEAEIARPLAADLAKRGRLPVYLVLCQGVPLKIRGVGSRMRTDAASVDSELAALKLQLTSGKTYEKAGALSNPYYRGSGEKGQPPIFLVTRLAGFKFEDVKGLIDRAKAAKPDYARQGKIILDQSEPGLSSDGDLWLHRTARLLPHEQVVLDETTRTVRGVEGVIGYASWGSNDRTRRRGLKGERDLGIRFLPGALATEYVSTNARTFREPPPQWRFGEYSDVTAYFGGSPQSLAADLIRAGATGVSGHVYEPYLQNTPRPDVLFRAYLLEGKTLGEAFWTSIPVVSWMNVVVGDPLCKLR